jgi:glycosyltransferase involved in cell wall biosynthesis
MKILHVIGALAPRYGGPSKACVEMAAAVARLGHEVKIFTTNIDGPKDLEVPLNQPIMKDRVEIRYFQVQQPRFWKFSLTLARALKKAIAEADVVHLHSLYLFSSMIAGFWCRFFQTPYIIRPHGTLDPFIYVRHRNRKHLMEFFFEDRNLQNAAGIHYTAEEEKQLAAPYTFQRPGYVIPNGINLHDYAFLPPQEAFSELFPETNNKDVILFLSRLNFKKGLDLLVPSFVEIAREFPNAHLVVAGPDDEGLGQQAKQQLQLSDLHHRVTFPGMLEGAKKLAAFSAARFFVLPSYSENFGIAIVEAMACGLPVIISNHVNIWREVAQAQAGYVIPCTISDLVSAMKKMLTCDNLGEMGKHGKQLVRTEFDWKSIGSRLECMYQAVTSTI